MKKLPFRYLVVCLLLALFAFPAWAQESEVEKAAGLIVQAMEEYSMAEAKHAEAEELSRQAAEHVAAARNLLEQAVMLYPDLAEKVAELLAPEEEIAEVSMEEPAEPEEVSEEPSFENWVLADFSLTADGKEVVIPEEYGEYPIIVQLQEDNLSVLVIEEIGLAIIGPYEDPDEYGWVSFRLEDHMGIPEFILQEIEAVLTDNKLRLPDVYWFEASLEGELGVLKAQAPILGVDYEMIAKFKQQ